MRERKPPTSVPVSVKQRSAVNEHSFANVGHARLIAAEMGVRTVVARRSRKPHHPQHFLLDPLRWHHADPA